MINKKTGLIALLASFAAGEIMAGTLTSYQTGDVLICFRNAGSSKDLVVDAGQISTFTNGVTPNQRITIGSYGNAQLNLVGVGSSSWSAFTSASDYTLFITKPRTTLAKQSTAWNNPSLSSLQSVAGRINSIITGSTNNLTAYGVNTSSAIVEADSTASSANYVSGLSYRDGIVGVNGSAANFYTSFQGVPENTAPNTFSTDGQVQRSDFYQVSGTGIGKAKFLGYFELNTNGAMAYVAFPSAVPVINSISRAGNQTTINYTAGLYGTYTLRNNTSLNSGTPFASWTSVSTLTSGDTTTHSITFTDNNSNSFYTITAQ